MSKELENAIEPFAHFWHMAEALAYMDDEEVWDDDKVVMQMSGAGASAQLTVGHFRNLLNTLREVQDERGEQEEH
jgi:hypothetical protein